MPGFSDFSKPKPSGLGLWESLSQRWQGVYALIATKAILVG
jgi:hypothetical protein